MLKQRDIILIPIPFTDLTSQKKRPAIIISNDNYNETHEDIVVVALTSNVESRDFTIMLTNDDMEEGTLKVTSMIRADKIYTLNKSIALKTFGRVTHDILSKIKDSFLKLIA
ncbi:MAG: type II toxin-antitoxin system PemK/MazF family toxin [Thermodesulfovibrionales bacterium]|nr:type II toxin-antitoxin system PemK/MazF family toxin [Thermodesulfovibrionales bacterium]